MFNITVHTTLLYIELNENMSIIIKPWREVRKNNLYISTKEELVIAQRRL